MLLNCLVFTTAPTPNPPPSLSITAPLQLPCRHRLRYIPTAHSRIPFSALLSSINKKVMAIVTRGRGSDHMIDPVVELMAHVINNEDTHHILQIDLRPLEIVLQDIAAIFRDPQKAPPEIVKVWLQLLLNFLAEAKRVLDRSGRRQRCLDCVVNNPRRPSKQIREYWNNLFNDRLYHIFQSELPMLVTSLQFLSSKPLVKEVALLQGVADSGFVGSGIIDAQAQVERWLNEGDRVHLIGVYGMPSVGKTSLLKAICHKYRHDFRMIWVRIPEDYNISDLQDAIEDQIYIPPEDRFDERKITLSAYFESKKFCLVLDDLWSRLDLQELGVAFGDGKNSKVLFSTCRKDLIGEMGAEESIEIQPLSREEAWMLFRRVAFKDDQVSMDIEARARQIADQCRGLPLAINVVATAMIGKTSVHDWDICLYSVKNVDPAFPGTHSGLNAELYRLLRWSYDTLPSSELKNCFLYCAMYKQDQEIDSRRLVQMWIGEGLVKSKQGIHIMDMAIGRSYVKLLVHRCLFQVVKESTDIFKRQAHDVFPSIRIRDVIREMAVYIAQKEENCLFMTTQNPPNFQEAQYNNCRRISLLNNYTGDLPSDLRCPKLATLILEGNRNLELLATEFVLSLTSLRVLNLSGCTTMNSVPASVGQLRLLEFLSLSGLPIEDLGEEICHLSKLQFLDLSCCEGLESLPSQIGELKNLKCLNLDECSSLRMIPREFSGLTSLSRLLLPDTPLSVETEAPASVWSLKGLQNLVELQVCLNSEPPQDGIMGTWSEMRHLVVLEHYPFHRITGNFPHDMQDMKKLQSFVLSGYEGPTFPNYKFEHLEMVKLMHCYGIRELSALEWLPNLKLLKLSELYSLSVLGIGTRVPSGYSRLEKLVLTWVENLESLAGPSNTGVWDERTLPSLRVLKIHGCRALRRLPIGMEKLRNLCALRGERWWWEEILWENDNMKAKLQKIFVPL